MDSPDRLFSGGGLEEALDALLRARDGREAAAVLAGACVAAGARGAELWRVEQGSWRRLAGAGEALPGTFDPGDEARPYPARVSRLRAGDLVLALESDHPGTDLREAAEDAAEALLATALALEALVDPGEDGPASALPAA